MFVVITDLHETGDWVSTEHAIKMLAQLDDPDFVVFSGDILYYTYGYSSKWRSSKCNEAIDRVMAVVSKINVPFMFTLGNHDAVRHGCRPRLATALQNHPKHIGVCLPGRATCIHPSLPIATIDAAVRDCRGNMASIGCPTRHDVEWIGDHAADGIIFTHFPPPAVLNQKVFGFAGEVTNCWEPTKSTVLPPHSVHAFGHDHDNMYVSQDKSLVSLHKSGIPSYGPSFAQEPGLTSFDDHYVPTFHNADGTVWTAASLPVSIIGPNCVQVTARFVDSVWFVLVIIVSSMLAIILVFIATKKCKRRQPTAKNGLQERDEPLLSESNF